MSIERHEPEQHSEWSKSSLVFVLGAMLAASTIIVLSTAPFAALVGPGIFALAAAMHGMAAFIYLIVSTIGLYLAWRLFMGRIKAFPDLQLLTTVTAGLSLLTILFGNWLYIGYRAKTPDSPRTYYMENMPEIHKIFFEFKEFSALFTLPLTVAAAFILWRYGREILDEKWMRYAIAILIALNFFYFAIAFGLGAAVTKLKAV